MKVILANKTAELVEKKSRFIANIFYVANEEEAMKKIEEIRKKYYDAKHNCFAYIIGKSGNIEKSSDDGEPSGTAGHPMLDILKGEELSNVIAIVTRYFGGVLLGTGGLVRAYSDSLKLAIKNVKCANINVGYEVMFSLDYDEYGKFERLGYKNELCKEFVEKINLKYIVDVNEFVKLARDLKDITKGRVIVEKNKMLSYYISDKKYVII